jgi:hypothetical protein
MKITPLAKKASPHVAAKESPYLHMFRGMSLGKCAARATFSISVKVKPARRYAPA